MPQEIFDFVMERLVACTGCIDVHLALSGRIDFHRVQEDGLRFPLLGLHLFVSGKFACL
jgi:hypothetical protein